MQQKPNIYAKAWILFDFKNQTYLRGFNTEAKLQIASITKIYTLYGCLVLNKQLSINPQTTYIQAFETGMTGTLARIQPGMWISLMDLYYGLMLPSGNDAACLLASYYGNWIINSKNNLKSTRIIRKQSINQRLKYVKLYQKKFVQFLNNFIVKIELGHLYTKFQNPHGLPDKNQVSTVWQISHACFKFMKSPIFAKICSTKSYRGYYYQSSDQYFWENSNILLKQGFHGIKTGLTTTAGGCLCSLTSISYKKYEQKQLLIVVLGSTNEQTRFSDTREIVKDYKKYLQMMIL